MEKDIEISGSRVHYEETGDPAGRSVLLMHGWGCDHTTVRSIATTLESAMRVINVDLPGHGKSPEPAEVWGVGEYAGLMEKLVDALGLHDPALIGHSFGGRVAIWMAAHKPYSKMMLVDAAGIKPKRPLRYYIKVYSFKTARRVLPWLIGKSRAGAVIERWRGSAGSDDYKRSSPMMRQIMSRAINQDLTPLLPQIKASTLLFWGERDTATPMRDARIMEADIPDAGLVAIPDAGHFSFLDVPGQFRAVAREFFKSDLAAKK